MRIATLVCRSYYSLLTDLVCPSGWFLLVERQTNHCRLTCDAAPLSLPNFSGGGPLNAADDYPLHIRIQQCLAVVAEGVIDRATLAVVRGE